MKPTLLKLTLMSIAGVAMLIGLGTWQLQRLAWKQGLIDRIETRTHGEPVALAVALRRWSRDGDVEYMRVDLSGRFAHDKERHLYTVVDGRPGWKVITPLAGSDGSLTMVDRGFVPDRLKEAGARQQGQVEGEQKITGLARAPGRKGGFTPDSDPVRNIWYWRDLDGMAASVLSKSKQERVVPFFVEAEAAPVPGDWPKGGVTRVNLSNRHLEYALTWFGLALALVVIYAIVVRRWLREGEFT